MSSMIRSWKYRLILVLFYLRGVVSTSRRGEYRLAVVKLDRLGDGVLALGAVRRVLENTGNDRTLLVVSTVAESLYRDEFPDVDLISLPVECERLWPDFVLLLWKQYAQFHGFSVDEVVCLRHHRTDYDNAVVRLLRPQRCHASVGTAFSGTPSVQLPHPVLIPYPSADVVSCRELDAHRSVVQSFLGGEVTLAEVMPELDAGTTVTGESLVVCPTANDRIRQYPPHLLAESLRQFLPVRPMPVQFCLPPGVDRAPWRQAATNAGLTEVTWCFPPTVAELVLLLSKARLILAPESAPAHIATALDKPMVAVLGGGHFGLVAPWSRSCRQRWLYRKIDCYGCLWRCRYREPLCLTGLMPCEISDALKEVYDSTR